MPTFPLLNWSVYDALTAANMNSRIKNALNELKTPVLAFIEPSTASNFTTTGTSYADISTTYFQLTLTPNIASGTADLLVGLNAMVQCSTTSTVYYTVFELMMDGVTVNTNGCAVLKGNNTVWHHLSIVRRIQAVSAASHTIKVRWKVESGATATLYARSTLTPAPQPQFFIQEIG